MSRKKRTHLRGKRGQAFADKIRGIPLDCILCVSIDIHKYFHVVMIHNALGEIVTPTFEIDIFQTGFDRLCQAVDEAVRYAQQREAFGKPISEFQAVQFMIADMSTLVEAARLLTYKAADLCDKEESFGKESAMAKLFASEAANKIVYESLQIHGGYGYSKEFYIEQLYRDARVLSIYEGTSEIQRLIISRALLQEDS